MQIIIIRTITTVALLNVHTLAAAASSITPSEDPLSSTKTPLSTSQHSAFSTSIAHLRASTVIPAHPPSTAPSTPSLCAQLITADELEETGKRTAAIELYEAIGSNTEASPHQILHAAHRLRHLKQTTSAITFCSIIATHPGSNNQEKLDAADLLRQLNQSTTASTLYATLAALPNETLDAPITFKLKIAQGFQALNQKTAAANLYMELARMSSTEEADQLEIANGLLETDQKDAAIKLYKSILPHMDSLRRRLLEMKLRVLMQ